MTLADAVRRELPAALGPDDPSRLAAIVREHSATAGTAELWDAAGRIANEVLGAGPLDELLRDPLVTDVLVNGPGPVWVDRGHGVERTGVAIADEATVRALAVRLVTAGGRRLDNASPYADARLPDGSRVHAVLPPAAPGGTTVSIRVPPRTTFSLDRLVALGSLPSAGADLLRRMVGARLSVAVVGGTGTGKTSVLSALLSEVDPGERVLLVEDAAELRPSLPHVVRLEARPANSEGAGAISLAVLVRQALRMRPDRLVVGEARGPEVLDLLSAFNTGHDGGACTVHANRIEDVPARFEAMAATAGVDRRAVHALLGAGLDAVVMLARDRCGLRRVAGLGVLARDGPEVRAVPAYRFDNGCQPLAGAPELDRRLAGRC